MSRTVYFVFINGSGADNPKQVDFSRIDERKRYQFVRLKQSEISKKVQGPLIVIPPIQNDPRLDIGALPALDKYLSVATHTLLLVLWKQKEYGQPSMHFVPEQLNVNAAFGWAAAQNSQSTTMTPLPKNMAELGQFQAILDYMLAPANKNPPAGYRASPVDATGLLKKYGQALPRQSQVANPAKSSGIYRFFMSFKAPPKGSIKRSPRKVYYCCPGRFSRSGGEDEKQLIVDFSALEKQCNCKFVRLDGTVVRKYQETNTFLDGPIAFLHFGSGRVDWDGFVRSIGLEYGDISEHAFLILLNNSYNGQESGASGANFDVCVVQKYATDSFDEPVLRLLAPEKSAMKEVLDFYFDNKKPSSTVIYERLTGQARMDAYLRYQYKRYANGNESFLSTQNWRKRHPVFVLSTQWLSERDLTKDSANVTYLPIEPLHLSLKCSDMGQRLFEGPLVVPLPSSAGFEATRQTVTDVKDILQGRASLIFLFVAVVPLELQESGPIIGTFAPRGSPAEVDTQGPIAEIARSFPKRNQINVLFGGVAGTPAFHFCQTAKHHQFTFVPSTAKEPLVAFLSSAVPMKENREQARIIRAAVPNALIFYVTEFYNSVVSHADAVVHTRSFGIAKQAADGRPLHKYMEILYPPPLPPSARRHAPAPSMLRRVTFETKETVANGTDVPVEEIASKAKSWVTSDQMDKYCAYLDRLQDSRLNDVVVVYRSFFAKSVGDLANAGKTAQNKAERDAIQSRLQEEKKAVGFVFPYNQGQNHWVCVHFDKAAEKCVVRDSLTTGVLRPDTVQVCRAVRSFFTGKAANDEKWSPMIDKSVARQANSDDCGIFTMLFMREIVTTVNGICVPRSPLADGVDSLTKRRLVVAEMTGDPTNQLRSFGLQNRINAQLADDLRRFSAYGPVSVPNLETQAVRRREDFQRVSKYMRLLNATVATDNKDWLSFVVPEIGYEALSTNDVREKTVVIPLENKDVWGCVVSVQEDKRYAFKFANNDVLDREVAACKRFLNTIDFSANAITHQFVNMKNAQDKDTQYLTMYHARGCYKPKQFNISRSVADIIKLISKELDQGYLEIDSNEADRVFVPGRKPAAMPPVSMPGDKVYVLILEGSVITPQAGVPSSVSRPAKTVIPINLLDLEDVKSGKAKLDAPLIVVLDNALPRSSLTFFNGCKKMFTAAKFEDDVPKDANGNCVTFVYVNGVPGDIFQETKHSVKYFNFAYGNTDSARELEPKSK